MNELDLLLDSPEAVLDAILNLDGHPEQWCKCMRTAMTRKDFRMYLVDTHCSIGKDWRQRFLDIMKELRLTDIYLDAAFHVRKRRGV